MNVETGEIKPLHEHLRNAVTEEQKRAIMKKLLPVGTTEERAEHVLNVHIEACKDERRMSRNQRKAARRKMAGKK